MSVLTIPACLAVGTVLGMQRLEGNTLHVALPPTIAGPACQPSMPELWAKQALQTKSHNTRELTPPGTAPAKDCREDCRG